MIKGRRSIFAMFVFLVVVLGEIYIAGRIVEFARKYRQLAGEAAQKGATDPVIMGNRHALSNSGQVAVQ